VFTLSPEQLCTHLLIVAPTGMGKTRSVLERRWSIFDRIGAAGFYLDAKGTDFAGQDFDAAHPHAFHLRFALDHPEGSFPLQLWSGRTAYDMAERLGEAILPEAGPDKQYFADNARNALLGLVLAHYRVHGRMPLPPHLLHYLRDATRRKWLADHLPARAEELYDLRRIDYLSEGRYDVLGSLDAALQPLTRGPILRLFAPWGEGYSVADLLRGPTRVGFSLPVGRYPRVARILGRLIVAQFTHAVLDPEVEQRHYKFLVVDERTTSSPRRWRQAWPRRAATGGVHPGAAGPGAIARRDAGGRPVEQRGREDRAGGPGGAGRGAVQARCSGHRSGRTAAWPRAAARAPATATARGGWRPARPPSRAGGPGSRR